MNFLGRSALLFDLPFVSFLVSFALTLCLSICQAHTHTPKHWQCQPAVCVHTLFLFSFPFSPTLRRSLREDRRPDLDTIFIFIFMCLHPNPRYRCFFLFHPLRAISFQVLFKAWEPRNPHQTSSSSYWHKHLASISGDLLTQHASSCHICRLIFEDRSKAFDLFTALSLINGSKNASRISSTCWAQIEEKLKWNESNCWISEIKGDTYYW